MISSRKRGPQKASKKIPVSIRLSPEVVKRFAPPALDGSREWTRFCGRISSRLFAQIPDPNPLHFSACTMKLLHDADSFGR